MYTCIHVYYREVRELTFARMQRYDTKNHIYMCLLCLGQQTVETLGKLLESNCFTLLRSMLLSVALLPSPPLTMDNLCMLITDSSLAKKLVLASK